MRTSAMLMVLLACASMAGPLRAEPQSGFGLAIGPTAHSAHVDINGVKQHYTSNGAGVTADAQFVFNDHWTLNPTLQAALETTSGDLSGSLGNSQAGLQLRYWSGNAYLAPALIYSVEDVYKGGTIQRTQYGPGAGLALGWESPTGLTLGVEADAPESLYFSSNQRRAGAWLQIGYRWH